MLRYLCRNCGEPHEKPVHRCIWCGDEHLQPVNIDALYLEGVENVDDFTENVHHSLCDQLILKGHYFSKGAS